MSSTREILQALLEACKPIIEFYEADEPAPDKYYGALYDAMKAAVVALARAEEERG